MDYLMRALYEKPKYDFHEPASQFDNCVKYLFRSVAISALHLVSDALRKQNGSLYADMLENAFPEFFPVKKASGNWFTTMLSPSNMTSLASMVSGLFSCQSVSGKQNPKEETKQEVSPLDELIQLILSLDKNNMTQYFQLYQDCFKNFDKMDCKQRIENLLKLVEKFTNPSGKNTKANQKNPSESFKNIPVFNFETDSSSSDDDMPDLVTQSSSDEYDKVSESELEKN
jgi:hypothetical protein